MLVNCSVKKKITVLGNGGKMSYRISYLVPKKEFERLTGKKQSRGVSIKSKEVPTARTPAPRGRAKSKITGEKRKRTKKARLPYKEKRGKGGQKRLNQKISSRLRRRRSTGYVMNGIPGHGRKIRRPPKLGNGARASHRRKRKRRRMRRNISMMCPGKRQKSAD